MAVYKNIITLNQNNRGCYILDTVKGCKYSSIKKGGCYGNCYAENIANRYGFDFTKPVKRSFIEEKGQLYFKGFYDTKHESKIIKQIKNNDMPFVRIGEMGDPSYYWQHTIDICSKIYIANKSIVIITKHWEIIPANLITKLYNYNIIINTSISALDTKEQMQHRLKQYNRLKNYCKSVLRVVTCDFNLNNKTGYKLNNIQNWLLCNENILETVFRPNKNNGLVVNKIIKTKMMQFLKSQAIVSMRNKNIFFGYCKTCKEMCGLYI